MENTTWKQREENLKTLMKTVHVKKWKDWYSATVTWRIDMAEEWKTEIEAKDKLINRALSSFKDDFNARWVSTPLSKPA